MSEETPRLPLSPAARARVHKYLRNGQLPLSTGFLQRLFVNGTQGSEVPIVQIHKIELDTESAIPRAKLALCDGTNTYTEVFVYEDLFGQLLADEILEVLGQESALYPLITLKNIKILPNLRLKLISYEFLCNCGKVPGKSLPICYLKMRTMETSEVFAPIVLEGLPNSTGAKISFPSPAPPKSAAKPAHTTGYCDRSASDDDPADSHMPTASRVPSRSRLFENSSSGTHAARPVGTQRPRGPPSAQHVDSSVFKQPLPRSQSPPPSYSRSRSPTHNPYLTSKYVVETATPIAKLAPGISHWFIVGLCTSADEVAETKKGIKAFNFALTDVAGTMVKISAYGEHAEALYEMVQVGQSYIVSNARIREVISSTHNFTGHQYELDARTSDVTKSDVTIKVPPLEVDPIPLCDVKDHDGEFIDLMAVIHTIRPLSEYTNARGTVYVTRNIELIDTTGSVALFMLYGRQAREFNEHLQGSVIAIKHARVQNHKGKIKVSGARRFEINLTDDAAVKLLNAYMVDQQEESPGSVCDNRVLENSEGFNVFPLCKAADHIGRIVDVLAVVDHVQNVKNFSGRERHVGLIDMTNTRITLKLRGEDAENFCDLKGFIIAIKGAEITEFKGKIFLKDGRRDVAVTLKEVNKLSNWYNNRSNV